MASIPEITDAERWVVQSTLKERYGKLVELQVADAELKLDPSSETLTACPSFYWQERGAGFVISKVAEGRYRSLFFYSVQEQYGTGRAEYDDLAECVAVLLKLQADHEKDRAGVHSGMTGKDLPEGGEPASKFVDF